MNTRKKSSRLSKTKNVKNKPVNLETLETIDLTRELFVPAAAVSDTVIVLEDSLNISSSQADSTASSPKTKASIKKKASKSPEVKSPRIGIGDCAICFKQLGSTDLCATKCGHVFCLTCLMQSLEFKAMCPTCREKLEGPGAYHPLYLEINK